IIERWCCILHDPDTMGEEEERMALTYTAHDQKFDGHSAGNREGQEEGVPIHSREVGSTHHDVGIPVEEFDELLQAPKATLETGHEKLGKLLWLGHTFQALIQILKHHSNNLHDGENEGAKGQGSCVVPCPAKGREERKGWQVVWLAQGPVVGGKGPSQCDLAQRQHEVGQPKEHEGIEDLQAQQCTVVARLTTIEGELASGVGAQAGFIGGREGLGDQRVQQGAHDVSHSPGEEQRHRHQDLNSLREKPSQVP
uniref:Uncharacterized protein n=1 Tax=Sciurus vulgaris TaxID=55149 RepID=A0A8D2JQW4_SCIVU